MEPDAWAAIAAWAGFATTAGAGYFTFRQARTAREALGETKAARRTAIDQANSARESALAAGKSADAAALQAKTADKSLTLAQAQKYDADQPVYEMEIHPPSEGIACDLRVRMRSGPTNVELTMEWRTGWARRADTGEVERHNSIGTTFDTRDMVRNKPTQVGLNVKPGAYYIRAEVKLRSREIGGEDRVWPDAELVEWGDPAGGDATA